MTLGPGTTVATYTLERLLGRGGMGEVYLATHAGLGRKVALKLLTPALAEDPRFRERFIAESRLAASLDHPHIVPIYEAGETDGRLFLAMRYVDGADLAQLIGADGRLEADRAIGLLRGIGAALDAAHDKGLVHRDVKPGNILVARTARGEEHAYLGDFGLTKAADGTDATKTGQLVGSVDYVAPEQIEGRPVDARADVYSLACVLYTCLTGSPPYPRETELATLWAHVQQPPPEPSAADPALAPFDAVIATGMAKDPADRYQSAGELMAAATESATGTRTEEAISPAPPTPPPSAEVSAAIRDLPAPLSELIGREHELAELSELLATHRLITITASGGSGKTRLALELGWKAPDPTADTWFIDLSAIRDPEMVAATFASRLGIADDPQRAPIARLETYLADRNALVILDNFEQVLDAAPAIAGLLAKAPRLRVVATSRAPLRIRGERDFPLGPLTVAGADDSPTTIAQSPAVKLFVERARDAGATISVDASTGAVLTDICRRLDSLPLAIELAAARMRDLDLPRIASGLDRRLEMLTDGPRDVAARQQTIRLTIDWSHELIGPGEATLFRRLSVFAGGFSAEAAEEVCGYGLEDIPTFLRTLSAQSLLVRHPATEGSDERFAMLETIREYAAEKHAMSEEVAPTRRLHADYFAALAERAEGESRGPDAALWRRRVRSEFDNFRAAIQWSIDEHTPESGLRLASALRSYLPEIGLMTEGRDWLTRLLDLPGPKSALVHANALNAAGNLAWYQGDFENAGAHYTASLALRREIGDAEPIAASLSNLGVVAWQAGDYRGAQVLLEDSLAKSREAGDAWGVAATLGNLADIAIFELDFERAETLYVEALADFRTLGDVGSIPKVLSNLGELAIYRGQLDDAEAVLTEARTMAAEIEDDTQINTIRINLAHVAIRRGRFEDARKLLADSYHYSRTAGEVVRVVECLERLGELVGREGDHAAAARIWGSAEAVRRDAGAEMYPVDRAWYEDVVASTRTSLGEEAFAREWSAGQGLDHLAVAAAYLGEVGPV